MAQIGLFGLWNFRTTSFLRTPLNQGNRIHRSSSNHSELLHPKNLKYFDSARFKGWLVPRVVPLSLVLHFSWPSPIKILLFSLAIQRTRLIRKIGCRSVVHCFEFIGFFYTLFGFRRNLLPHPSQCLITSHFRIRKLEGQFFPGPVKL